jgi:hypothetical protein
MDVRRLILKVERASIDQSNLRTLLASADAGLAALRSELRIARASTERSVRKPVRLARSK